MLIQKIITIPLLAAALFSTNATGQDRIKKEKLQIVFCFGQSNMVGLADVRTAWYLTQPSYVPPRELILEKTEKFDWNNLYWQGVRNFDGPQEMKDQLQALLDERRDSRDLWRDRIKGKRGAWNEKEWGVKPEDNRTSIYEFLEKKETEAEIFKRVAAILDSPANKFTAEKAYEEVINRDRHNAEHIQRVRDIYLKGTEAKNFEAFDAAVKEANLEGGNHPELEAHRLTYAKLAEKHLNLPIAKRTYVSAYGAIAGSKGKGIESETQGPLSVGYGANIENIGPEYGVGITLERLVDAPILLVKCAWGNTSIREAWRPASLDGVETPAEKAAREEYNQKEIARAKEEGREPKLREAPKATNKLSWAWSMALPHVRKVLANPGDYHPDYDPEVGYEIAGLVWFQGYSDSGNEAYGELLTEMIKWFRKEIDAPGMPVVSGTMGVGAYYHMVYQDAVNAGMVQAARAPELKGKVDVVNTGRYFPHELPMLIQTLHSKEKGSPERLKLEAIHRRANSNKGFHYYGSAKFFLLAGDAMGRSLANLMAGGEPMVEKEIKNLPE